MCNYCQSCLGCALPSLVPRWGESLGMIHGQLTYVPNNSPSVLGEDEGGGDRWWYDILYPVYRTSVENVSKQPSYMHAVYSGVLQDYLWKKGMWTSQYSKLFFIPSLSFSCTSSFTVLSPWQQHVGYNKFSRSDISFVHGLIQPRSHGNKTCRLFFLPNSLSMRLGWWVKFCTVTKARINKKEGW